MKDLSSITNEDLIKVINPPKPWEVFSVRNDKYVKCIKVRVRYDENEIHFNEDGYKYNDFFLNIHQTTQYLRLIELGYQVEI